MYFKCAVPIPRIQGKITVKKLCDAVYVYYEYDCDYNPGRRYAIPPPCLPRQAGIGRVHAA